MESSDENGVIHLFWQTWIRLFNLFPSQMSSLHYHLHLINCVDYLEKSRRRKSKRLKMDAIWSIILNSAWFLIAGIMVLAILLPFVQKIDPTYFFLKEISPSIVSTLFGSFIRSLILLLVTYHWNVAATHLFYYLLLIDLLLVNANSFMLHLSRPSKVYRLLKKTDGLSVIPICQTSWNQSKFVEKIQHYNTLILLTRRANSTLRWGLLICVVTASVNFILSVACLIYYFETLPITTLMIFPGIILLIQVGMFLVISPAGRIMDVSTKFLLTLRTRVSNIQSSAVRKENKQIVLALRPCSIEIGSFVNIHKSTMVELYKIWIGYTIDLLLFLQNRN